MANYAVFTQDKDGNWHYDAAADSGVRVQVSMGLTYCKQWHPGIPAKLLEKACKAFESGADAPKPKRGRKHKQEA